MFSIAYLGKMITELQIRDFKMMIFLNFLHLNVRIPFAMIMFQLAGERVNKIIEGIIKLLKFNGKKVTNLEINLTKFTLSKFKILF